MASTKMLVYDDGVLVREVDERTVPEVLACREAMVKAWADEHRWDDKDPMPTARAALATMRDIAAQATSDDDKAACDLIQAVQW